MYISCYIEEIWITFLTVFFLDFSSVPDSAQFNSMLSRTVLNWIDALSDSAQLDKCSPGQCSAGKHALPDSAQLDKCSPGQCSAGEHALPDSAQLDKMLSRTVLSWIKCSPGQCSAGEHALRYSAQLDKMLFGTKLSRIKFSPGQLLLLSAWPECTYKSQFLLRDKKIKLNVNFLNLKRDSSTRKLLS